MNGAAEKVLIKKHEFAILAHERELDVNKFIACHIVIRKKRGLREAQNMHKINKCIKKVS